MKTPNDILSHYKIRPRKNLGQSFLIEQDIIKKIVLLINPKENEIIVEIGAGIGVMTEYLAQHKSKVLAVELDNHLAGVLKERLSSYGNVRIYHQNVLKIDLEEIAKSEGNKKIKIVGNIPYNISTPILFKTLFFRNNIDSFVLMMQKEMVQRLVASPGGKEYGVPSVILQMFAKVENVLDVPAYYFHPRPKVESSVMKGFFFEQPIVELSDEDFFIKLVRDSFAQRRKMLINNLKNSKLLKNLPENIIRKALEAAQINGQRRAETLTVKEFGNLSNVLLEYEIEKK